MKDTHGSATILSVSRYLEKMEHRIDTRRRAINVGGGTASPYAKTGLVGEAGLVGEWFENNNAKEYKKYVRERIAECRV